MQFPQNWQSLLTINISRLTAIQHVHYACILNTITSLLAVGLAPFNCIWFIGPSSATERASDDQRLGSLDDTVFVAKLFIVENWPDWGPKYSVASFSWFHELQCTENRWHDTSTVNCRFNHSILSLHLCKEYLTAVK